MCSGAEKIMITLHKVLEQNAEVKPFPLIGWGISDFLFQRYFSVFAPPPHTLTPLKHRNTEDQFVGLADTTAMKLVLKKPTCLWFPQRLAKVLLASFLATD